MVIKGKVNIARSEEAAYAKINARIDNIIAAGTATEGNSELIDVRIGNDGIVYESAGAAVREQIQAINQSVIKSHPTQYTPSRLPAAPYDDLNTVPVGTIVCYTAKRIVSNAPDELSGGFTVLTFSRNTGTLISQTVQMLFENGNKTNVYVRYTWGGTPVYNDWCNLLTGNEQMILTAAQSTIFNTNTPPSAPWDDLDTIPSNRIVSYNMRGIKNAPSNEPSFTVVSFNRDGGSTTSLTVQIAFYMTSDTNGALYMRTGWGSGTGFYYNPWQKIFNKSDINITPAIFPTWGGIGDSFMTGKSAPDGTKFYLSWVQLMARKLGCECTNYSISGSTTRTWLTDVGGLEKLQSDTAKDFYWIAFGINDSNSDERNVPLGTIDDLTATNKPDTFYGNMGKIHDAVLNKNPKAKICYITIPRIGERYEPYSEAIV
ncbi:MAG: SGNH/GDSL hydrolase family protein, partial [Clostridia bacterium]|nr:SGNH/GDSL hydrolase family protein [Clostridia bacterium]